MAPGTGKRESSLKPVGCSAASLIEDSAAPLAFEERLSSFDRDDRDKEEAQIVIDSFQTGGRKTAVRACPRLIVDFNFSGLYPADKKEEDTPPDAVNACSKSQDHVANIPVREACSRIFPSRAFLKSERDVLTGRSIFSVLRAYKVVT